MFVWAFFWSIDNVRYAEQKQFYWATATITFPCDRAARMPFQACEATNNTHRKEKNNDNTVINKRDRKKMKKRTTTKSKMKKKKNDENPIVFTLLRLRNRRTIEFTCLHCAFCCCCFESTVRASKRSPLSLPLVSAIFFFPHISATFSLLKSVQRYSHRLAQEFSHSKMNRNEKYSMYEDQHAHRKHAQCEWIFTSMDFSQLWFE